MSLCDRLFEAIHQEGELGRMSGDLAWHQCAMACRLAQSEKGFQGRHDVASATQTFDDLSHFRGPNGIVHVSLVFRELAVQDDLTARRELGRYIDLEAAKDEGAKAFSQGFGTVRIALRDGIGVSGLEAFSTSEEAAIEEVKLAPQLVETIFNRGPRQGDSEIRLKSEGRLGDLAFRVLDVLCLVEDDTLPALFFESLDFESEDRVAGEDYIGLRVQLASGTMIDRIA